VKYDVGAALQYMLSLSRRKALLVAVVTPQCATGFLRAPFGAESAPRQL
jgi:hypothetical protein